MKVAVSAAAPSLDAPVDPRFGRCACFVVVETDTWGFEAVENANRDRGGGAGIQAAQLVARTGATAVLTGSCGPNAHRALGAARVGVVVGCSGSVSEAIRRFMSGQLPYASGPNAATHAGACEEPR